MYQNSNAKCTKMSKIEVANTQFVLKHFFVFPFFMFPAHCAFCLCEVLPSIQQKHNYMIYNVVEQQ